MTDLMSLLQAAKEVADQWAEITAQYGAEIPQIREWPATKIEQITMTVDGQNYLTILRRLQLNARTMGDTIARYRGEIVAAQGRLLRINNKREK